MTKPKSATALQEICLDILFWWIFKGGSNLASRLCSGQPNGFPSSSKPGRVFCSLQKVFSITAGAWLQVHCFSQQALLERWSCLLVPGFSSAVSGLSFHQLRRDEGTALHSGKYSMSFTDVHTDLLKTHHLFSSNFFYSWPYGHWVFSPFVLSGRKVFWPNNYYKLS